MLQSTIENVISKQQEGLRNNVNYVARDLDIGVKDLGSHAIIISGIRRCGKSMLQKNLLSKFKKTMFLNFEDTRLVNFLVSDFTKLLKIIEQRDPNVLFFDEIQIVDGWEIFVRQLLDEHLKVCITGSNASLLSKELGTKLTGRHIIKELYPFNYKEYLAFKKNKPSQIELLKYLEDGGFPEFLESNNTEILQGLFSDILVRDIAIRFGIRDVKSLQYLASFLVSNVGKLITGPKLKSLLQLRATSTILEYLGYLEQSWLFFFIPKFSYSLKSRALNPKKVYCIDNGLINANTKSMSADLGRKLENLVFLELRRKGLELFYFSKNGECDFVAFKKNKIIGALQVCTEVNEDNLDREVNGLIEALEFFELKTGQIVTLDQTDIIIKDGYKIELISLNEFIQQG